jgi:DNA adenine methylase
MARRSYLTGTAQADLFAEAALLRVQPIAPLIRWPGGKSAELDLIRANMPPAARRYFEPFVGGGAVFLAISDNVPAYLNDISQELIDFYAEVAAGGAKLCDVLQALDDLWKSIEVAVDTEAPRLLAAYAAADAAAAFVRPVEAAFRSCGRNWLRLAALGVDMGGERLLAEILDSVSGKILRMRKLEAEKGRFPDNGVVANITGAIKAAVYYRLRWLYNRSAELSGNRSLRSALFFFIREYAYAAMFRYNSSGAFNVPYGGISYNRKFLTEKLAHLTSASVIRKFGSARIERMDFAGFFTKHRPEADDFIFVDPPYDSRFSEYGRTSFGAEDHQRLAQFLLATPATWMLVIKSTELILELYAGRGLIIRAADKKYQWTIKERNVRDTVHLMISNYNCE